MPNKQGGGTVNLIQWRAYRVHLTVFKLLIVRFNTDWFRPKNETIFLKLTMPYKDQLTEYLKPVFTHHPDFHETLDAILISQPHLDHTMNPMEVMKNSQ